MTPTADFTLLTILTGLASQVSWDIENLVKVMMQANRSGTLYSSGSYMKIFGLARDEKTLTVAESRACSPLCFLPLSATDHFMEGLTKLPLLRLSE